jgi:hypothetical protein
MAGKRTWRPRETFWCKQECWKLIQQFKRMRSICMTTCHKEISCIEATESSQTEHPYIFFELLVLPLAYISIQSSSHSFPIFASDKRHRFADVGHRRLEGNTTVDRQREASIAQWLDFLQWRHRNALKLHGKIVWNSDISQGVDCNTNSLFLHLRFPYITSTYRPYRHQRMLMNIITTQDDVWGSVLVRTKFKSSGI